MAVGRVEMIFPLEELVVVWGWKVEKIGTILPHEGVAILGKRPEEGVGEIFLEGGWKVEKIGMILLHWGVATPGKIPLEMEIPLLGEG